MNFIISHKLKLMENALTLGIYFKGFILFSKSEKVLNFKYLKICANVLLLGDNARGIT